MQHSSNQIQRYIGNAGLLLGQGILLYSSIKIGIVIKLLGMCVLIPAFTKLKMWDVVMLMTVFGALDLSRLLHEFF